MEVKKVEESELSKLLAEGQTIAHIEELVEYNKSELKKARIMKHIHRFILAGTIIATAMSLSPDESERLKTTLVICGGTIVSLAAIWNGLDAASDVRGRKKAIKKFNAALEEAEERGLRGRNR